jgi:hypothetical protein
VLTAIETPSFLATRRGKLTVARDGAIPSGVRPGRDDPDSELMPFRPAGTRISSPLTSDTCRQPWLSA